jgi:hypothetical protein
LKGSIVSPEEDGKLDAAFAIFEVVALEKFIMS